MRILVLCSGGIKSACLIGLACKEIANDVPKGEVRAIFFDHGQVARDQEWHATEELCKHYDIRCYAVSLPTRGGWMPFKLSLLVFYALHLAHLMHFDVVYYGAALGDERAEESCEYLKRLQALIDIAQPTFLKHNFQPAPRVEVESPLLLLDRKRIIFMGTDYKTPWQLTWSCDQSGEIHCGLCTYCKRRHEGFNRARISDPTHYRSQF